MLQGKSYVRNESVGRGWELPDIEIFIHAQYVRMVMRKVAEVVGKVGNFCRFWVRK